MDASESSQVHTAHKKRKYGSPCAYCREYRSSHPDRKFFSFPANEDMCNKWIVACDREYLRKRTPMQLHKSFTICSEHFKKADFLDYNMSRLKPSAIPSFETDYSIVSKMKEKLNSKLKNSQSLNGEFSKSCPELGNCSFVASGDEVLDINHETTDDRKNLTLSDTAIHAGDSAHFIKMHTSTPNRKRCREIEESEELQAKWKSLRDCNVRYLRNTNIKKGQSRKCVKKYVYAPYLEFLRPVTHLRKPGLLKKKHKTRVYTTVNDHVTKYFGKDELDYDDDGIDNNNNDGNDMNNDCYDNDSRTSSIQKKVNGVEKGPYIINMVSKEMKTSMECINSMDNHELGENIVAQKTTDDDMDFFRSLLPFIKSLPLYQKISFRADIMKIAKEYGDKLEKSHESLVKNALSFKNCTYQQRMYLPVVPIQSLSFQNLNSNQQSSIENMVKNLPVTSLNDDDTSTTSPSL